MRTALQAFEHDFERGHETVTHDLAFHLSIAHATGNRYFQEILQHFGNLLIPRNRISSIHTPARDPDYLRRDLYDAIDKGDFPEWDFAVQILTQNEADALPFDILDATKLIPEELVPLQVIGVLSRKELTSEQVEHLRAESQGLEVAPVEYRILAEGAEIEAAPAS